MEFVTDRTQAQVDRLKKLRAKGWHNFTDAEKAEWYIAAAKGAYNYLDLNRVESAVAEIAAILELDLTTKTDWSLWDTPTQGEMSRYLGNVRAVRDTCPNAPILPDAPLKMTGLTFEMANRIEAILFGAWKSAETIPRAGELFCGEV